MAPTEVGLIKKCQQNQEENPFSKKSAIQQTKSINISHYCR